MDAKAVNIKVDDKLEERLLTLIPSSVRQEVIAQLKNNIKSLGGAKDKGRKVGQLQFKSCVKTFNLRQYGNSHKVLSDKKIHITKIGAVRVRGLGQLENISTESCDFATAKITKKASGYYCMITTFQTPKTICKENKPDVGLDFGIESQITTSDGIKFKFTIPENRRLKLLQRKLNRKINKIKLLKGIKKLRKEDRGSNFIKLQTQIKKKHEKLVNKRKEIRRKVVSFLKNNYNRIVIQDEQIAKWGKSGMKGFGKRIQHSAIGGITGYLKKKPTTIVLGKLVATSLPCYFCGCRKEREDMSLDTRIYSCYSCGNVIDRDVNAAINIETLGTNGLLKEKLPLEQRKVTLLEINSSTILGNTSLASVVNERRNYLIY